MSPTRAAAIAIASVVAAANIPAHAHEFWVQPAAFQIEKNGSIQANLKIGEKFEGDTFPYVTSHFRSYTITDRRGTRDNVAFEGDIPSVKIAAPRPGLTIITYHSIDNVIEYDNWQDFVDFAAYEGNAWAAEAHLSAGLPKTGFSEQYTRCAKALVQVGKPRTTDLDRVIGCPLELIADGSPYLADSHNTKSLRVELLWQGEPLAEHQINVFERGNEVALTSVRTNEKGVATIPAKAGREYLLNAVHMSLTPNGSDAEWHSYWASLTYQVPER